MSSVRVVASGTNVAVGAGAQVVVASNRTRLVGRLVIPQVWLRTTTVQVSNGFGPSAGPVGGVLQDRVVVFVRREAGDGAEVYDVVVEHMARDGVVPAQIAVAVGWAVQEWRP